MHSCVHQGVRCHMQALDGEGVGVHFGTMTMIHAPSHNADHTVALAIPPPCRKIKSNVKRCYDVAELPTVTAAGC
jgi:hypothetical protein